MTADQLDQFTRAYAVAALWSSTDDEGEPLDKGRHCDDIAPDALAAMAADCAKFQADNAKLLTRAMEHTGHDLTQAGHDFWLTRNGHGAGFWDGDWKPFGDLLTDAAKAFPEVDLYVGDDGLIHA